MSKFLKSISLTLAVISVSVLFSFPYVLRAETPVVEKALYAYLYSVDTNQVLFRKNADHKIYPASFVKIMTAILALEYYGSNITQKITVTAEAIENIDKSGNYIALQEGEILTAEQLINAIIVGGANDATNVIAYDVAGGIEEFVALMNEKAVIIGTVQTIFTNPTGIHDEKMYTTLDDFAKIALYAYRLNRFSEMASQRTYIIPPTNMSNRQRRITNRNLFVSPHLVTKYYDREALGLNAGATPQAGQCLATVVNHDGLTYLCIITGASSDEENIYSYIEARKLLDWVYSSWHFVTVLKSTDAICEIPVTLSGDADSIALYPQYEIDLYLPMDADIAKEVDRYVVVYENELKAPVESNFKAGELSLYYKGELISAVPLITKTYVDQSRFMYFVDTVNQVTKTRLFRTTVSVFILLMILYVILTSVFRYQSKLRKKRRRQTKTKN